jgi:hypothetical protein
MPEPGVIRDYLTTLSEQLPAGMVEELADGLDQTRLYYLDQGLGLDAAADAALAEFGDPHVVVAAFTRMNPARRAARRVLATGPVAGAFWGAALITSRAWAWPVPVVARALFGVVLITAISLLAAAAFGRQYRSVSRAAVAGCVGIAALDAALVITVILIIPALIWPMAVAVAASMARITFTARTLRAVPAAD